LALGGNGLATGSIERARRRRPASTSAAPKSTLASDPFGEGSTLPTAQLPFPPGVDPLPAPVPSEPVLADPTPPAPRLPLPVDAFPVDAVLAEPPAAVPELCAPPAPSPPLELVAPLALEVLAAVDAPELEVLVEEELDDDPHALAQFDERHWLNALAFALVVHSGFVPMHVRQLASSAQATPSAQHEAWMHVLHAATCVERPQLDPLPQLDAQGVAHAVSQMHASKASSSLTAVVPAVVWQPCLQEDVLQAPRQSSSVMHAGSFAHALASVLQAPDCALVAQVEQVSVPPTCWPMGVSARKLVMKPPAPVSLVTRMSVFCVMEEHADALPVEVVPTTVCALCAAPAGRRAGPPLSPSHVPWMCEAPP
jgi:hypothetical protein